MVIENQINCECARASPVDDGDGITYCENCGVELNSSFSMITVRIQKTSAPHLLLLQSCHETIADSRDADTYTPVSRAMHARNLVRLVHPNPDSIQKVALEYVELGWDESTTSTEGRAPSVSVWTSTWCGRRRCIMLVSGSDANLGFARIESNLWNSV